MRAIKKIIIAVFVAILAANSFLPVTADTTSKNLNMVNVATYEPTRLDPQIATTQETNDMLNVMMEGLMRRHGSKVIPGMAYKYVVSKDGLTYTFYLRNALWSDGKKVKADDFVYAWKRALDPNSGSELAFTLYYIKNAAKYNQGQAAASQVGIKAINENTLQVVLEKPTPYFVDMTANIIYLPVRKDLVDKYGEHYFTELNLMVFNGPFKLDQWLKRYVTVVKNQAYWNKSKIKIDGIRYHIVDYGTDSTQAYLDGNLDVLNVTADNLAAIPKNEIKTYANGIVWYVQFNNQDKTGVFSNMYIRKALSLAIDRPVVIKESGVSFAAPALGLVAPEIIPGKSKSFRAEAGSLLRNNDVQAAKKALNTGLKQLKLKKLPKLTIMATSSNFPAKSADSIAKLWKKNLGIEVAVEKVDLMTFLSRGSDGKYQMSFTGWSHDYYDAMTYLELFSSNDGVRNAGYRSKVFGSLVSSINKEKDRLKRIDLLKQAEKKLVGDAVIAPVYFKYNKAAVKPYLKNVVIGAYQARYDFTFAEFVPGVKAFNTIYKVSIKTEPYWYTDTRNEFPFPGSDLVIKDSISHAIGVFYSYEEAGSAENMEQLYHTIAAVQESKDPAAVISEKTNTTINGFPAIRFRVTAVDGRDNLEKVFSYAIIGTATRIHVVELVTETNNYDSRKAELEKMFTSINVGQ